MKNTVKYIALTALMGSLPQALCGQERGEMIDRLFSRMDQNKDGVIDQSEAPAEFWSRMGSADRNQDNKIDKAEAAEGMRAMAGRRGPGEGGPAGSEREKAGRNQAARSSAVDGSERLRQLMNRFGKDGKITLADLPGPLQESLAKLDSNEDKVIDQSELKGSAVAELFRSGAGDSQTMERLQRMIQSLDKDGDGKVAIADIPGDLRERLAKLDKNGDGQLERSEMAELRNMMGAGRGAPAGEMLERMQQMFRQFDKDGDGKVTLAELPEMARERLSKLDSNDDGEIDKSELKGLSEMGKRLEGKPGEGRDGLAAESTAPQAPKRPDSK